MTTANLAPGSNGGASVDFSSTASMPFGPTEVYKLIGCGLCGKNFTTLVMAPMRDCPQCTQRQAKRREEMSQPLPPDPYPMGRPRRLLDGERLRNQREYQRAYRLARRALSAKEATV